MMRNLNSLASHALVVALDVSAFSQALMSKTETTVVQDQRPNLDIKYSLALYLILLPCFFHTRIILSFFHTLPGSNWVKCRHVYSPHFPPYISFGTIWRICFNIKGMLSLINFVFLTHYLFEINSDIVRRNQISVPDTL